MATPRPETFKLIQYLIQAVPESLDAKSRDGYTPLALAFSLHRLDAVKALIRAGADQTVRDSQGNNLLHLLICPATPGAWMQRKVSTDMKAVQPLLELIDKRLISSFLTERSSRDPGSLTPVANWLRWASESPESTEFLRALLEFAKDTENEHLELLDASGDTPLHYIVKSKKQSWLKAILDVRPDLLYRENSVGRTPYELSEDAYIAQRVKYIPGDGRPNYHHGYYVQTQSQSVADRPSDTFAPDYVEPEVVDKESIWRVCSEFLHKHPDSRKIVSLLDANEVAKRLAVRYHAARTAAQAKGDGEGSEAGSDAEEEEFANYDEVDLWYGSAREKDGPVKPVTYRNNFVFGGGRGYGGRYGGGYRGAYNYNY
jgi:hypothetical protein